MPAKTPLEDRGAFARWLIETMRRLGLDNRTLAKQTGASVTAVVNWRTGRRLPTGTKLYLLGLLLDSNELALRRLIGEARCEKIAAAKAKAEIKAMGRIQAPSEVA